MPIISQVGHDWATSLSKLLKKKKKHAVGNILTLQMSMLRFQEVTWFA